jgi:hypothetical protein
MNAIVPLGAIEADSARSIYQDLIAAIKLEANRMTSGNSLVIIIIVTGVRGVRVGLVGV